MDKQYYAIKNKNLAISLSYLLNKSFFTYDDTRAGREGKKIYSFEDNSEFRKILTLVNNLHKENK